MGAYRYKLTTKTIVAASPTGPVTIGICRYAYKPYYDSKIDAKLEFRTGCGKARAYWADRDIPRLVVYEHHERHGEIGFDSSGAPGFFCPGATMIDDSLSYKGRLTRDSAGGWVFTPKPEAPKEPIPFGCLVNAN